MPHTMPSCVILVTTEQLYKSVKTRKKEIMKTSFKNSSETPTFEKVLEVTMFDLVMMIS